MSSFCDGCEAAWQKNDIMACALCELHIQKGWTTQKLLSVYGSRRQLYNQIGLKNQIFPPMKERTYMAPLPIQFNFNFNLARQCYKSPVVSHNLSDAIQNSLKQLHRKSNNDQKQCFVQQELRVLREMEMADTKTLVSALYNVLDPLTQRLLSFK